MTELLAPAGNMEALRAAIANGADAVYLGGKSFSARAFADNFTISEIVEAVELAHFHGLKVYVTINTLINDKEMVGLLFYAAELYKAGVDAVIAQDIGMIERLHHALPDLPLHASTQMTINNAAGADLLAEYGVSRVILPREMTFADMAAFHAATTVEAEGFVHGALCVCYSGQCLFSSMVGGRSGNRGRCAQPCRMAYQLCDQYGDPVKTLVDGKYLLSPRDLFGYEHLSELYQQDLAAWKIEGRMKKPHYVATVCRIYSQAMRQLAAGEEFEPQAEDLRQLSQVFNRDHCDGYWHGNAGAALMSFARPNNRGVFLGRILSVSQDKITLKLAQPLHRGDGVEIWTSGKRQGFTAEVIYLDEQVVASAEAGAIVSLPAVPGGKQWDRLFKTYDAPLMEGAELSYHRLPDQPLYFHITAQIGQKLSVSVRDKDGREAAVESAYVVEPAQSAQKPRDIAFAQLGRLGGSGYALAKLQGDVDEKALLPTSVLNQIRRELIEQLQQTRRQENQRRFDQVRFSTVVKNAEPQPAEGPPRRQRKMALSVLVNNRELALAAAERGVGDIYVDAIGFMGQKAPELRPMTSELKAKGARLIPSLPQVIKPTEEKAWLKRLPNWKSWGIDAIQVHNIGQAALLRKGGWERDIFAGWACNIYNSSACQWLSKNKIRRATLSPELNISQLRQLEAGELQTELFAQGALQLMVSEYCLYGAVCGLRNRDKGQDTPCLRPCQKQQELYLRDEKGYSFPLRCDTACRMHIFNSREHCLFNDIPELSELGIDRLLLDLRLYPSTKAQRIIDLYRDGLIDRFSFEEAKRRLPALIKDYTKGHLNRGV